ncbi:MAG: hypothetical protein A3F90_11080 [Deltaproteobacteria bacterium RIFCSPLOWO2_12_FULL_60_19]|nr:MAG: hypothetical protein A3F90_11080 [Deltaproteobacteria bacterium RIFCSPLOWO2_12_FULL_60_19]
MTTLRCTKRLLRRLRVPDEFAASPPTTLLGDWYANILFSRPQQLVLCMSERTLLPVVVLAKELDTLPLRLAAGSREILDRIGVPQGLIESETREMAQLAYGPTRSKRVLGSMNDFMFQLSWLLNERPGLSLLEMSVHIAETPCSPLRRKNPKRFTLELFRSGLSGVREIH